MEKQEYTQQHRSLPWWPSRLFYGWAIALTGFVVSFASVTFYGPLLSIWFKPIQDSTGWSSGQIAAAFSIGSLSSGILTWAIGRILDRYGARQVIVLSGVFLTGSLIGLALMSSPWHLWLLYGSGRAVTMAGVQLGTTVTISNWFIKRRASATAVSGFGQRLGQALLPLAIVPVILTLGWREAFAVMALPTFLLIVIPAYLFIRRRPEDYGLQPDGVQTQSSDDPTAASRGQEYSFSLSEAKRIPAFWLLVVSMAFIFFAAMAVNIHAAPHFQEKGISLQYSAFIVFTFAMTSAVMTAPWAWLMDRIHIRFGTALVCGVFVLAMGIVSNVDSFAGSIVFGLVFGVAQGGWTLSQRLLVPNYFGRASAGAIRGQMGLMMAFVTPVGPVAAGILRDVAGNYDMVFVALAIVFISAGCLLLLAIPGNPPSVKRQDNEATLA